MERADEFANRLRFAGKGQRVRAVDRRDAKPVFNTLQQAKGLFRGQFDGGRQSAAGHSMHQPAAVVDDPEGVPEANDPGGPCRGHFTQAVPNHRVRLDAPRPPERRRADLKGERAG